MPSCGPPSTRACAGPRAHRGGPALGCQDQQGWRGGGRSRGGAGVQGQGQGPGVQGPTQARASSPPHVVAPCCQQRCCLAGPHLDPGRLDVADVGVQRQPGDGVHEEALAQRGAPPSAACTGHGAGGRCTGLEAWQAGRPGIPWGCTPRKGRTAQPQPLHGAVPCPPASQCAPSNAPR